MVVFPTVVLQPAALEYIVVLFHAVVLQPWLCVVRNAVCGGVGGMPACMLMWANLWG